MIRYAPAEDPIAKWPPFVGPLSEIPKTRAKVYSAFGNPGRGSVDLEWMRHSIVERQGANAIPGIPPRWYFQCHRLVEPYIREALRRAAIVAPDYRIERAGGFVFRHIRHDLKKPLSLHSWGIAIDIDSTWNRGIEFKNREDVPDFFSSKWKQTWPNGMPREFVDAWLSVGWTWGGDWDRDGDAQDQTYVDPMHMQLCH